MQKFVIANWKMNGGRGLVEDYVATLRDVNIFSKWALVVCPPFPFLEYARMRLLPCVDVGAQDCSEFESGARTGDVSCSALCDVGSAFVIVGHSERRRIYGETDDVVKRKAEMAQKHGLTPVICVGESLEEYEGGRTQQVIERQIKQLGAVLKEKHIIAYEPIWAIGTGKTPSPQEISDVHQFIKKSFNTVAVYGGSVTLDNYKDFAAIKDVGGLLVGGESLKIDRFTGILCGLKILENV
jgi:triosephosphate isomerase